MQTDFQQKVVFVTGAASGIGQAQALLFAQEGAWVTGVDVDSAGLLETQARIAETTGRFLPFIGDVTSARDLTEAVRRTNDQFGVIDILLNTAGKLDHYAPALETSEALWDQIMAVNLKSMFLTTQVILPQMLERKKGIIINMASIAGQVAGGGGAAYTASKHAIVGYTKQLAYDYVKQGIRVNAIAPGAIETPMNAADFAGDGKMAQWVAEQTPAGRWAQPTEVAALTLYLASEQADYLHGCVLPIDGGWLMQ